MRKESAFLSTRLHMHSVSVFPSDEPELFIDFSIQTHLSVTN